MFRPESQESFDSHDEEVYMNEENVWDEDFDDPCNFEDDGQPTEYEEWQDLYGCDDWDHGQYDGE